MLTPEPEQADDSAPRVHNTVLGAAGGVVQAGVVHGDVHLHAAPLPPAPVVPRQLPAAPGLFTGRTTELAALDRTLIDAAARAPADLPVAGATVVVSAIGGAGGIGKTWLALAWAHSHLDRFPDGQLFVDLHGFSPAGDPMTPGAVVRGFLDALGVDPGRVPTDLGAQAALYRSIVAGRRMLIVLDNAAAADQVVPLLPGSPTCTVLVTGRHRLASLIDRHGAHHLTLGVLTRSEARASLTARVGADRVAAEPDSVDELVALCGSYPLALSIAARNAATRPDTPLAEIAAELRELGLEMFDHDTDPAASLPTVLSWSLRRLTDTHRTVFRLLGTAPGPDSTLPAVVSLTSLPTTHVRRALSTLEEASLVERRPGGRYAMHDLVRSYAATTARDTLPDGLREAALVRVVDFFLHTTHAADRLLEPRRGLLRPDPPAPGVHPLSLPDVAAATAWLEAERATVLACQRAALALGRHQVAWHFAWALETFHFRRGRLRDALAAWRAALDAAAHLPDPIARSRAHRLLGHVCSRLGLHEEATAHMEQSLVLAVSLRDPVQQAHIHRSLAAIWEQRGDDRRAMGHARQALDLYRTLDRPVWEAGALNLVGWFAARLDEFDTARDHCRSALDSYRHQGHLAGEASTRDSLGLIAYRTNDHQQAVDHYHQALTLYRTLGYTYLAAGILDSLGHPHTALGHHDQARAVWLEALELYREQGRATDAERVQSQLDRTSHDQHGAT